MKFSGICSISILAQKQNCFVAPLVFLWINVLHPILSIEMQPLTALLIGAVIAIYQQTAVQLEDFSDGFFEYCKFNCKSLLSYAIAKTISVWITTILPMAFTLLFFGFSITCVVLIALQWVVLSICTSLITIVSPAEKFKTTPLNLLLAWLPMLIAPIIFLTDYLHYYNENSLLIFLGCDIIIMCAVFLPFHFSNQ